MTATMTIRILKTVINVAGIGLTFAGQYFADKAKDAKISQEVAEQVAEAMSKMNK